MSLSELWTNPDFDGNTYLRNLASNHNTHKDPNFLNGKEKNANAAVPRRPDESRMQTS